MNLLAVLALVLGASALSSESSPAGSAAELDIRAIGSSCKYSVRPVFLPHPSSQLDLTIPSRAVRQEHARTRQTATAGHLMATVQTASTTIEDFTHMKS